MALLQSLESSVYDFKNELPITNKDWHVTPRAYLQRCSDRWKPLPDEELEGLPDECKDIVRHFEAVALNGEFAAFSDIILNCTNKFQFAKTYKVLRDDYQRTFANASAANPNFPPEVNRLIRKIAMSTIERKLDGMAWWFWVKWGDQKSSPVDFRNSIEQYTNSGCAILFLLPWATLIGGAYLVWATV